MFAYTYCLQRGVISLQLCRLYSEKRIEKYPQFLAEPSLWELLTGTSHVEIPSIFFI